MNRHIKMGRSFRAIAQELRCSETAFVFRLPASRVRAIQDKIKMKNDEFEEEYEEKVRAEDEERLRATGMMMMLDNDTPEDNFTTAVNPVAPHAVVDTQKKGAEANVTMAAAAAKDPLEAGTVRMMGGRDK
uniref:Palmitoyltransferase AKR1 n=1 Tax=Lygus hesperus TaxID=30085 RepID=A0A0A9YEU6_LYGHE